AYSRSKIVAMNTVTKDEIHNVIAFILDNNLFASRRSTRSTISNKRSTDGSKICTKDSHHGSDAAVRHAADRGHLFTPQDDSHRTGITKYQRNEIPNIRTKL
ncbi:MAG: hypothetical protein L7S59_01645, partial [Pseudomonadales bacterium]|nr:hypothetical protein [Pseudomonadales bacterium]